MKTELVKRKITDLKPDPDQPRKKFDKEAINNLAQTMKTQGIINPIEIDEKDIIITGEMRWRAAQIAFKNGELFDCKLLTEINPAEKFARQTVENIHHNAFTNIELEKATKKNWDNRELLGIENRKELADFLGLSKVYIDKLIKAVKDRKELGLENIKYFSTTNVDQIASLPKKEQKPIIDKIKKEEIRTTDIPEIVSEIKKLPSDVKTELMKPNVKITKEKLEEARETAKLTPEVRKEVLKPKPKITLEEAKEVDKMPEDIKKEVLKPKSELTVKDAKMIADISKPEIRKEAIKHMKQEKKQHENTMKYIEGVAKGTVKPPTKVINLDQRIINQFIDIKKQVITKMSKRHVESYNEPTKVKLYKIMKDVLEFLQNELNMKGGIINV